LTADARLGQQAKLILTDPASLLVFPLIVIHEAVYIAQRRPLSISGPDILNYIKATRNASVYSFTLPVLEQILQLPQMDSGGESGAGCRGQSSSSLAARACGRDLRGTAAVEGGERGACNGVGTAETKQRRGGAIANTLSISTTLSV